MVLIETMAGKGTELARNFDEIAKIPELKVAAVRIEKA